MVLTAVLLVARVVAARFDLPQPSVEQILKATGASRSRAYEIASRLAALLPSLVGAPGRPAKTVPSTRGEPQTSELSRATLEFVGRHPGCLRVDRSRRWYAASFRRFVLELCRAHPDLDLVDVAHATLVPLGTLKDWLRTPGAYADPPSVDVAEPTSESDTPPSAIQMVVLAWKLWKGPFVDFCEHVRRDLDLDFGRDLVRRILRVEAGRRPTPRDGQHHPDEIALRGTFRTHFPGAQWVGDGFMLPVKVDGQPFIFNVELNVDAFSGGFVGLSVRDTEDSLAVQEAYETGVATTGAPPLSLLLDNKPSNHVEELAVAIDPTFIIRATPERPQNKAHVEGAFGLFSRTLPPLTIDTTRSAHEQAHALAELVSVLWARASNHRPRQDRGGRSRADLYGENATPEQIESARRELRQILERQELARRTLEARRRPEILAELDDYFERLGLLDPNRHLRVAIAGYPSSAITAGLSIFTGKTRAKTLPDGADARYLLGIVRNISADLEAELFAEELYDTRIRLRDRILARLRDERDQLRANPDPQKVADTCVDRALEIPASIERTFWLETLVDVLRALPEAERKDAFRWASRRIQAAYAVPQPERQDAVRFVADRLVPLP